MEKEPPPRPIPILRWKQVYRETELYQAALRVYTKPLFQWRKALSTSTDGKTLYDFASRGLRRLHALHSDLRRESFTFRPATALHYNFNGKHRTLYLSPWEERIVDLMLYRMLNRRLHGWFSPHSYAYRQAGFGLDCCQKRIASTLRRCPSPQYLVKRDIADYFACIPHRPLLAQIASLVDPEDYLFRVLQQRVQFSYVEEGELLQASAGVPFGTAVACLFANIFLTRVDRELECIPEASLFRYADDILVLSSDRSAASRARQVLEASLADLNLKTKPSHQADLVLSSLPIEDPEFEGARRFRHLGLLFQADGMVSLSRDKLRKIQNLFRFGFRRSRRRWSRPAEPEDRFRCLIQITGEIIERGLRNVAILDYYLRHVNNEAQLRLLDRWLAEEVLHRIFGGHRKGNFRKMEFRRLRELGLPSLVHRRRLILRGEIESPFFLWQREKSTRASRGTVVRR